MSRNLKEVRERAFWILGERASWAEGRANRVPGERISGLAENKGSSNLQMT